jgi:circadian clock protein KaiC
MNTVSLIKSGFTLIDENWGGIYRGGSYLTIGPRKSGRTLLGLQYAMESAKSKEVCLYFTNMRPKDLMIQAASIDFDIQSYMNENLIIVVRVAPPNDIYEMRNPDDYLIEYLNDIITVIEQYNPHRIIFDELTPYIGFRDEDLLEDVFVHTLETIENENITSMFVVGEPATQKAESLVNIIASNVTGVVRLNKKEGTRLQNSHVGKATIIPNIGHTEGTFNSEYKIEPKKGVITKSEDDLKPKSEKPNYFENYESEEYETKKFVRPPSSNKIKSSGNNNAKTPQHSEAYTFSNIYEYNDFNLLLNNQIALYKSTGQKFTLVSLKLNPAAQVKGLLSLKQLQNAVKYATEKKDKICVVDDKIIVLIVRSDNSSVENLVDKMKDHLPSDDAAYLDAILSYISLLEFEVNEGIEKAEDMMDFILNEDQRSSDSYIPVNKYYE